MARKITRRSGTSKRSSGTRRSKFTSAERAAFNSGKGFAVAHKGKKINFNNPALKQSFAEGYRAGAQLVKKYPSKYTDL